MRRSLSTICCIALGVSLCGCAADALSSPTAPTAPTAPTIVAGAPVPMFIRGTVSDTAFRSLAGAHIEVLDGLHAGLVATSDARGAFAMTGVFDDNTRFRASKEGYAVETLRLRPFCEPCNPHRWVHFALDVPAAPAVIAGTYDVTFAIDPTCGGFPAALHRRTHTAVIAPDSRRYFEALLIGGSFGAYPYLEGGIAGNYLAFWLEGLAEQLSPNSYLIYSFVPSATIESSPRVIDAVGAGDITYCELLSDAGPVNDCWHKVASIYNVCRRDNHRLTFTRK